MVGATVVIGVALVSYSGDTGLSRTSVLAENMRQYHEASVATVRMSGETVNCGPLTPPDLGRYRAVIDWTSRIERAEVGSSAFVITYSTGLTAANAGFTDQEVSSIPLSVNGKRNGVFRTATWDANFSRPSDGFRPNTLQPAVGRGPSAKGFAQVDFRNLQIPNGAPVIITRVGTCTG
jgi:hypothetical protein